MAAAGRGTRRNRSNRARDRRLPAARLVVLPHRAADDAWLPGLAEQVAAEGRFHGSRAP
jgi:hypothetical protein